MHVLTVIALFAFVVVALAFTLVKTCVDLLERGPYEAPLLLCDEGMHWPLEQRPSERIASERVVEPRGHRPYWANRESSAL